MSDDLQAVLAEAIYHHDLDTTGQPLPDVPELLTDTYLDLALAVIEALRDHRDLVPAAIGMEQVGWMVWENPEAGEWTAVDLDYEDLRHFPHRPLFAGVTGPQEDDKIANGRPEMQAGPAVGTICPGCGKDWGTSSALSDHLQEWCITSPVTEGGE